MDITLYHWTSKGRLPGINRKGLRLDYAETADGLLYAVGYRRILDGMVHVAKRHGWRIRDLVCVRMVVPFTSEWVSSRKGFYRIKQDVPRERLSLVQPMWEPTPMASTVPGHIPSASISAESPRVHKLNMGRGQASTSFYASLKRHADKL